MLVFALAALVLTGPCPRNTYSSANSTNCLPCPIGTGTDTEGGSECVPCPPGTYCNAVGRGCMVCPADFQCPFGGAFAPSACSKSSRSHAGSIKCSEYLDVTSIVMITFACTLVGCFGMLSCVDKLSKCLVARREKRDAEGQRQAEQVAMEMEGVPSGSQSMSYAPVPQHT
jgi:hypothetical protein